MTTNRTIFENKHFDTGGLGIKIYNTIKPMLKARGLYPFTFGQRLPPNREVLILVLIETLQNLSKTRD